MCGRTSAWGSGRGEPGAWGASRSGHVVVHALTRAAPASATSKTLLNGDLPKTAETCLLDSTPTSICQRVYSFQVQIHTHAVRACLQTLTNLDPFSGNSRAVLHPAFQGFGRHTRLSSDSARAGRLGRLGVKTSAVRPRPRALRGAEFAT